MTVDIHHLELIMLLLLLFVVTLAVLARRINQPYPIVFVLGGLVLSFVPPVPDIALRPDFIFLVVLPPLLFAAATNTSWRDFRGNLTIILMLAFGLVAFTVVGVALAAHWFIPRLTWRTGLVLGAVVSTTDAIAATSIARKLGLPHRITDILEGESLINDASGLLALSFAVGIIQNGHAPSFRVAVGELLLLAVGGVAIGLALGWIQARLIVHIQASAIETTIALITPYVAYLLAERIHTSGVMAVVACGLYLGNRRTQLLSLGARLEGPAIWNTIDFTLNGVVFLLLGLQISTIMDGISGLKLGRLIAGGIILSLAVIFLRFVWVFPGVWIAEQFKKRILHRAHFSIDRRGAFIVAWAGMRGVIALAAALSLPLTLNDGTPFPGRNIIIFFTFCIILVTLVGQGLSLPSIIRRLGLSTASVQDFEEKAVRDTILHAALAYLEQKKREAPEEKAIYESLELTYRRRLSLVRHHEAESSDADIDYARRYLKTARSLRDLERKTANDLLARDKVSDAVYQRLMFELDLLDARDEAPL